MKNFKSFLTFFWPLRLNKSFFSYLNHQINYKPSLGCNMRLISFFFFDTRYCTVLALPNLVNLTDLSDFVNFNQTCFGPSNQTTFRRPWGVWSLLMYVGNFEEFHSVHQPAAYHSMLLLKFRWQFWVYASTYHQI